MSLSIESQRPSPDSTLTKIQLGFLGRKFVMQVKVGMEVNWWTYNFD
jgi:hypothetical protein